VQEAKNIVDSEIKEETGKEEKKELPIIFHEREIMESLENNIVTIVCGETGSGKSTQIPQFILQNHVANPWKYRTSSESL
jgi:ATP-dependent RNA helicase DHX37/DHR1